MSNYLGNEHRVPRPDFFGGGEWTFQNLNEVNVLIGRNGSGKSLILRALRDQSPGESHYIVPERIGEISFQTSFLMEELDGTARRNVASRNFVPQYREHVITRIQAYFQKRGARRGPAASRDPTQLEVLLRSAMPDFNIELDAGNPPYKLRRTDAHGDITDISALSSGEAQLFTLTLDILLISAIWELEDRQRRILLIDEPDAHIHPDLQARFSQFLISVAQEFSLQVFVSTHSTALLSALAHFGQNKTNVLYVDRRKVAYRSMAFDAVKQELATCLGGHVLMGALFGAPILLVEGDDDHKIWSQIPRYGVINAAVIPCNGEQIRNYQKDLERMFGALCDPPERPLGYALLDGDKALPGVTAENRQQYIKFIKLNCHESENLYLAREVMESIAHPLDEVRRRLAENFPPDRAAALHEILENRQWSDLKPNMRELTEFIDIKNVPWTLRVAATIGKTKPTGEVAEYLGEQVIRALWE